ncbi:sulfatase [Gaoshiqia sediminis]|uniref:Sulfatase n=1 Tax=Gaoshiqia sediminis TaxID=2986998 RepID=A0AA41YAV3_9BACT|nr:sulfatase [Gaoshiqia sediminis]MCW0484243.1 sulfatase [Gaoshiqia sediminis]
MKKYNQVLTIGSVAALQLLNPQLVEAQKKPTNVLLIVIDDLNDYPQVLYDYPGLKTPNLTKFAETGVIFKHAYCAAPVCNPSRAAFLSGMAPYKTGVYDNNYTIENSPAIMESEFLPEHFKKNGYTTFTRGKIFHTIPGKARYEAMWDIDGGKGNYGPQPETSHFPDTIKMAKMFDYQPWEGPESDHPDNITAEMTIEQLQKDHDKPFFLACGFYKPHNPWTAPKRFFDMYPLETQQMPPVNENDLDDLPELAKKWASGPVDYYNILKRTGQYASIVRSYLACISFLDYNFGRVLDALEKSNYRDNTIVVVVADNGFHMGEKLHFAKYALWEKTTHILCMWRVPGMTKTNVECQRPVNLLDLYPTLDELCNLPSPSQKLDGRSIVPLLKDPDAKWEYPSVTTYLKDNYAIRDERYRYIQYHDGTSELYDHESDKNEYNNLMKSDPDKYGDVVERLKKYIPDDSVVGNRQGGNPFGL